MMLPSVSGPCVSSGTRQGRRCSQTRRHHTIAGGSSARAGSSNPATSPCSDHSTCTEVPPTASSPVALVQKASSSSLAGLMFSAAAAFTVLGSGNATLAQTYGDLPGMLPTPQPAQAELYAAFSQPSAAQLEEDMYDELLMTPDLKAFVKLLETNPEKLSQKELDAARLKVGFQRAPSGLVSLRSRQGQWYAIKADTMVPGFLLALDPSGYTFVLPPDPDQTLAQLDLSDDIVVAQLFSSTAWQDVLQPVNIEGEDGQPKPLILTSQQFRQIRSLMTEVEEVVTGEGEEAEEQSSEGQQ